MADSCRKPTIRLAWANDIDLSSYSFSLNSLQNICVRYLQGKNISIDEKFEEWRHLMDAILSRRLTCTLEEFTRKISKYELILFMFFNSLADDVEDIWQGMYEILMNKFHSSDWSRAVSALDALFRLMEEDWYVILDNLSTHPNIPVTALPKPIKDYVCKYCKEFGLLRRGCAEGNTRFVRTVLDCGVALDTAAFHAAITEGNTEVVTELLERGAKPYWANDEGRSAIYFAVEVGHVDIFKSLLAKSHKIEVKYNKGMTLLHIAAKNGHADMVQLLIEKDFDVNAKSNQGETPMHLACKRGNLKIVSSLIAKGAEVDVLSLEKKSPLHIAVGKNSLSLVEKILATSGADVDLKTGIGATALHIACRYDFYEVAKALLRKGAKVCAKTAIGGNTPAHFAATYGHVAICELLSEFGCMFDQQNHRGRLPLHAAVLSNEEKVFEFLVSVTRDLDTQDINGETALHLAAFYGRKRMIVLLLGRGAEWDLVSNREYKAVHCAAEGGHADAIKVLKDHGADVNAKTQRVGASTSSEEFGLTPLQIAVRGGKKEVVDLLSSI